MITSAVPSVPSITSDALATNGIVMERVALFGAVALMYAEDVVDFTTMSVTRSASKILMDTDTSLEIVILVFVLFNSACCLIWSVRNSDRISELEQPLADEV